MTQPPERLYIVLHSIESAVAMTYALHRKLLDKDVEYVYEALQKFFKGEVAGRELPEPYSTSPAREQMIDLIFQRLEDAEEEGAFDDLIDGSFAPGGKVIEMVEELYVMSFNSLIKSVRLWRKENGPKGYLNGPINMFEVELERVENDEENDS